MAATWGSLTSASSRVNAQATAWLADPPGDLWFQMKPPGVTTRRIRVNSGAALPKLAKGWTITGEYTQNAVDGWGVFPPDIHVGSTASYAGQTGAPGGLWTHTPVDWQGNEPGKTKPGGWPADAATAVPPNGSRQPGGVVLEEAPPPP